MLFVCLSLGNRPTGKCSSLAENVLGALAVIPMQCPAIIYQYDLQQQH